jgi:hypothetical protein
MSILFLRDVLMSIAKCVALVGLGMLCVSVGYEVLMYRNLRRGIPFVWGRRWNASAARYNPRLLTPKGRAYRQKWLRLFLLGALLMTGGVALTFALNALFPTKLG